MQTGPTSQISIFDNKFHDGLTWLIFIRYGLNLVQRSLVSFWTDSECLKWLRPCFDLPARRTKTDQERQYSTSMFFVRFGWNSVWGLIMAQKQHRMCLKCLRSFFDLPVRPTENRPIAKIFNFYVFCPIWMKFGVGANNGPKTTWNEFEMPTTIFRPTSPTNQNRPIAKIFNFCVFRLIWMKFGMEAHNGPKTT